MPWSPLIGEMRTIVACVDSCFTVFFFFFVISSYPDAGDVHGNVAPPLRLPQVEWKGRARQATGLTDRTRMRNVGNLPYMRTQQVVLEIYARSNDQQTVGEQSEQTVSSWQPVHMSIHPRESHAMLASRGAVWCRYGVRTSTNANCLLVVRRVSV